MIKKIKHNFNAAAFIPPIVPDPYKALLRKMTYKTYSASTLSPPYLKPPQVSTKIRGRTSHVKASEAMLAIREPHNG